MFTLASPTLILPNGHDPRPGLHKGLVMLHHAELVACWRFGIAAKTPNFLTKEEKERALEYQEHERIHVGCVRDAINKIKHVSVRELKRGTKEYYELVKEREGGDLYKSIYNLNHVERFLLRTLDSLAETLAFVVPEEAARFQALVAKDEPLHDDFGRRLKARMLEDPNNEAMAEYWARYRLRLRDSEIGNMAHVFGVEGHMCGVQIKKSAA